MYRLLPYSLIIFQQNTSMKYNALRNYNRKYDKWLGLVWFMVFNATFKNFSVISWRSVLFLEETGVPRENHRPVASH